MKKEDLVAKYNEGLADPAEIAEIERLIEDGAVELTQLRELDALNTRVLAAEDPSPTLRADERFYAMLAAEKRKQRGFSIQWPTWSVLMPRVAFASVILIAGFAAGYWLRQPAAPSGDVAVLTKEVSDLKEMMMLSLLKNESASDRMRAVSLTNEMDKASAKVTEALFATLNSDPNVNVRLAALEAIVPFASQGRVREQLIRAISQQESPLVQVTLAELMVTLQEKKSVSELQKVVDSAQTPKEVKEKIKKSIAVLI
jgi:hypothetical protein